MFKITIENADSLNIDGKIINTVSGPCELDVICSPLYDENGIEYEAYMPLGVDIGEPNNNKTLVIKNIKDVSVLKGKTLTTK